MSIVSYSRKIIARSYKSSRALLARAEILPITVQGNRMFLDPDTSRTLGRWKVHEPFATDVVRQVVNPGDVALDIGANVGYYSLILADLVGSGGMVFAFEPDPTNYSKLKKNVRLNRRENVVTVRKAVSEHSGKAILYLSDYSSGMHRLHPSPGSRDFHRSISVDCVRLDDYLGGNLRHVDFIKIDIEGAEVSALKGMASLIEQSEDVKILTEFAPIHLAGAGVGGDEYLELLSTLGFSAYYLNRSKHKLESLEPDVLLRKLTPDNGKLGQLLCARRGKLPPGLLEDA